MLNNSNGDRFAAKLRHALILTTSRMFPTKPWIPELQEIIQMSDSLIHLI